MIADRADSVLLPLTFMIYKQAAPISSIDTVLPSYKHRLRLDASGIYKLIGYYVDIQLGPKVYINLSKMTQIGL